jgi:hypothetical protein
MDTPDQDNLMRAVLREAGDPNAEWPGGTELIPSTLLMPRLPPVPTGLRSAETG